MKEGLPHNKALVQRIIQGDEKAFQEAFYAYKDQLFSYCYRFTKSEELAEEIVHDALLKVWTGRKTLDPERSFIGYLYTITRNLALNFLKKLATDKALQEHVWQNQTTWHNDTEQSVQCADLEQIARMAIRQLPPQQQQVYRMSRDQHLTHEEIAQRLNVSKHTVRNHIIKALQAIKNYLRLHTDISFLVVYLFASGFF